MGVTYTPTFPRAIYVLKAANGANISVPSLFLEQKLLLTDICTLIRFGKFEEITVLMAKTCNFDSNISDFNSVDLKKAKK
jgi:hypothetical protein